MKTNRTKQRGFTLAEMAIVVVLGGILLAAGLLAGRGQISRAQTQDVLQMAADLQTAAASFKQRYGYLPGDLPTASTLLPAPGNVDGSGTTLGNGLIEGSIGTTAPDIGLATAADEVGVAPAQLYAAGLIGKLGTNTQMRLQSQFGPVHMAVANTANTSAAYVAANPAVKNVIIFINLPCEVAFEVDRALDDGNRITGRARQDATADCAPDTTVARYVVPL